MEHDLQFLVADLANTIAFNGLQLEHHANNYIKKQLGLSLATGYYQHQDNNKLDAYNTLQYDEAIKKDLGNKSAFLQFYQQNQDRFQRLYPQSEKNYYQKQALLQFDGLSQSQKAKYLYKYLQVPLIGTENIQIFFSNHQQGINGQFNILDVENSSFGLQFNPNSFGIGGGNNKITGSDNSLKIGSNDETKIITNDYSQRRLNNLGNSDKNQNKNRADIYKMALAQKGQQKTDRNSKNEDQKEKQQFQTLKSLFKKLQNTA